MMYKEFPIEAVLSVTTGRLFGEIGGVYEIMNFMTGQNLFTHQLPRAVGVCGPDLNAQHPGLSAVDLADDIADIDAATVGCRPRIIRSIVERLSAERGATLPVHMAASGAYEPMNPIEELVAMRRREDDA